MTYPPIDERMFNEPPSVVDRDRAYWYARGFIAGNPPLGGLLLSSLEDDFPPGANATGGFVAADVLASMFADAFICCPHGDIELAFIQWMARALPQNCRPSKVGYSISPTDD